MKVVHLTTFERAGGAAIAASRLHLGLRSLGHASTLLVRDRTDGDPVEAAVAPGSGAAVLGDPALELLLFDLYRRARRPGDDRLFSTDLPTRDVASHPVIRSADVVNLHWTCDFVSVPAVRSIQDLGRVVVWTLHDQAPFTGGCHYSGDCDRYTASCGPCPYLEPHAAHAPALVLRHKREWLQPATLDVVCPSGWLANRARASALLRDAAIHTIPNCVPVEAMQAPSRADARAALGVPADATLLLLAAERLDETRKGGRHAALVLDRLAADPRLDPLIGSGRLLCAALGQGRLPEARVPVLRLGRLAGDPQLALAYRAADLFLLPTLEDNLPNTMLEAVAAGVPVAAYAAGGVPEFIARSGCGTSVTVGDDEALAAATAALLEDEAARQQLGARGMAFARREITPQAQAAAYVRVYEAGRERLAGRGLTGGTASRARPQLIETERALLRGLLHSPDTSARILGGLAERNAQQQRLIDGRGGEIEALRAGLDDAVRKLRACQQTANDLRAEHAALTQRWRRTMVRVAIYGAGAHGQRVWEAVAARGTADVVAFIDDDPRRHGRAFLGTRVRPPDWLLGAEWDVLAVAGADPGSVERTATLTGAHRIVVFPVEQDEAALARMAARVFPDPLAAMLAGRTMAAGARVGIFGTGAAGMKVWEALTGVDDADAAWFADNDPARQGQRFLWLPVIAPSEIPAQTFDALVVGSMSRDPILRQLKALGIGQERIVTPDVTASPERIRHELEATLPWRREASTQG
jgi:glycosyltransferase involved in cell wall biosynthesis